MSLGGCPISQSKHYTEVSPYFGVIQIPLALTVVWLSFHVTGEHTEELEGRPAVLEVHLEEDQGPPFNLVRMVTPSTNY